MHGGRADVALKVQLAVRLFMSTMLAAALAFFPLIGAGPSRANAFADEGTADNTEQAGESGESTDEGGEGEGGETPVDPGDDQGLDPVLDPKIQDVMIFTTDGTFYGSYTSPCEVDAEISAKGGQIDFEDLIQWDTWDENWNFGYTTWSVSDDSIATITQGGVLTAVADGTVQVYAEVDASHSATGSPIAAVCNVVIYGQEDLKYVTNLRITDENGTEFAGSTCIITDDLSVAMMQFQVNVYVFDAATQEETVYNTRDGLLSQQVEGLSDVYWYMGDPNMGTVDQDWGMFRPARYGTMILNVSSNAGLNGEEHFDSVTISMRDPNGGMVMDDYHPQQNLTVLAYYELYPPENPSDPDDEAYVINQTFELDDLLSLGTVTQTYTALGTGSYYTLTGTGPALASVLGATGISMDDITILNFGTADLLNRPVSYQYIVGTDRYYYPNVDIGSYAEAQQVYPILAIESNQINNASTAPDYNMTESTRYRLLFGSTGPGDVSSQYQIKWINTLYVTLAGGPPYEPGSDDPEDPENPDDPKDPENPEKPEKPDDSADPEKPDSGGEDDGGNSGNEEGGGTEEPENGGDQDDNGDSEEAGGGNDNEGSGSGSNADGGGSGKSDNGGARNSGTGDAVAAGNVGDAGEADKGDSVSAEESGSTANQEGESDRTQASEDAGGGEPSSQDSGAAGVFSVYQVLSDSETITQTTIDYENPFGPYLIPLAIAVFLLGMAQSVRWYLLQTRATVGLRA